MNETPDSTSSVEREQTGDAKSVFDPRFIPTNENSALSAAFYQLPKELKESQQVAGAFRTGFRLGWKARDRVLLISAPSQTATDGRENQNPPSPT